MAKNHLPNTRCSFNLTPLLNDRCGRGREAGSRYNCVARRWPLLALLAGGCDRLVVLNPKGPIADAERGLMIDAFTVMMIVVVPVIVMALLFAWRYRAGRNARYEPTWAYSAKIDAVVWLVPALIVIAVAVLLWRSTHKLDPYREIASQQPAARRPGRGPGLEVAVHLSRAGHRRR